MTTVDLQNLPMGRSLPATSALSYHADVTDGTLEFKFFAFSDQAGGGRRELGSIHTTVATLTGAPRQDLREGNMSISLTYTLQ